MNFVEFQDGDRTFKCEAKSSPATPDTMWWWMTVSGESQRYAAFRVEPTDNFAHVRSRMLAYYRQLIIDRERPRIVKPHWSSRPVAQPKPA